MRWMGWMLLLSLALAVHGVQTRVLTVDELARRAHLVLRGKVIEMTCVLMDSGRLCTRVEVDVRDVWKGAPRSARVRVVLSGGVLGERRSVAPGQVEFVVGEEVIVFAVVNDRGESVCIGLDQGKFRVITDPTGRHALAVNRYHGLSAMSGVTGQAARSMDSWRSAGAMPLDELERRVRSSANGSR